MPEPILHLDKATIRFGGLTAVNALDLVMNDGDLVGLIGPNEMCIRDSVNGASYLRT